MDFFEVTVDEGGFRRKAWKFLLRLPFSGRTSSGSMTAAISSRFSTATCAPWSPTSGGVLGANRLRQSDRLAVKRRVGVHRELTDRFLALVSHYLFEPCFTRPGEGHDKGSVARRQGLLCTGDN